MEIKLARYRQNQLVKFKAFGQDGYKNGFDNLFSNYLDSLYNASPTHSAIVNDLTSYIVGKGLRSRVPEQDSILKRFFPIKKTTDIVKYDVIQNAKSFEVLKNLNKIEEINVIKPSQIRVLKIKDGEPCVFRYRQSFNPSEDGYKITGIYDVFNPNKEQEKSLFYSYNSGTFEVPYGRPYYMSGMNAIELEAGLYLSQNHGVMNGMFPNSIIIKETTGDPVKDRKEIADINNQASGPANAGKTLMIHTAIGEQNPPQIVFPTMTGMDKVAEQHYRSAEVGITKSHGLPSNSLIAGLNIKPTGFSDAEAEMQWALNQWYAKKIEPYRQDFIEDLKPLFEDLGIDYKTIYFADQENNNEQEVVVEMSKPEEQYPELFAIGDTIEDFEKDGWAIDSIQAVDYDKEEELDKQIEELNKKATKLVSTGTARPNTKSEQDGNKGNVQYKIRYRYAGEGTGERAFCAAMTAANKLYRKEDLINMSFSNVNPGFGPGGSNNYNIFLYKGGPNCKHYFERITFVKQGLEGGIDTRSPRAKTLTETQADERGINPRNNSKVGQKPINMPDRGYLNPR